MTNTVSEADKRGLGEPQVEGEARTARPVHRLRFGILGCGVIGPHHARALADLSGAELVAVADTGLQRAEKLAGEFGCTSYSTLDEMLSGADLDAVCVCTPSGRHAEHAIAALQAGKHVVIEKPVDVTLAAADRLLAEQRASGKKAAVVSQHRFDAATLAVRDAVGDGRFGRLTLGSAEVRWWRSQEYYDSGGWRGTRELDGGGVLINQAIHSIDLLQWLMGPVVEVAAYSGLLAHERIEVEDTAVAVLRFEGGAVGTIVATTAAYPGLSARIAVNGDRGSAVIDDDRLIYFHAADAYGGGENKAEEVLKRYGGPSTAPGAGSDPGSLSMAHRDQLADFVEAVKHDREPSVTVEEGRKPLAIIAAIYESARRGKSVRIEERDDNACGP